MDRHELTRWAFQVSADAEVERHPDCPVCGEEGCEINHTSEED